MIRMADTDPQEQLYLCILKLLKKGSDDDFNKLQELCEEISKVVPDLKIPNIHSTCIPREYTIDEGAKQQLTLVARKDLASFIPVKTVGDGSCLFRALSFLCFGHPNRHRELRVRCIIEMALNRHLYDNLFEKDFNTHMLNTCNPNEFAERGHIHALGVILKRKIELICTTIKLREHEEHLNPEVLGGDLEPDKPPLKIMCILDEHHFVPLIPPEVEEEGDSGLGDSLNESNKADTSTLKKTKDDSGLDSEDKRDISLEGIIEPPFSSTPKKPPKASDDGNVNNEQNEDSDDDEKVDITSGDVMNKFKKLFGYDIGTKLLKERLSNETLQALTGPYDVADPDILGILKKCPNEFVTKLFEIQFQIKWKTEDGMPKRFNFYKFCNVEKQTAAKTVTKKAKGKTVHLKYGPRRAHVFTELYREAIDMEKVKREEVFCLDKPKEEFCPDVYVRGKDGWVRISFGSKTCEKLKNFKRTFSWMHQSLLKFVADAEEVTLPSETEENYFQLVTAAIKKPTLYWAVLKATDFKSGDHLQLNEIGRTQVYVGKADGGIMSRWIKDNNSHSKEMKRCADNICNMKKSFDVHSLHGIQLVDARLLLAKTRAENNAVFLIQTFKDKDDLKKGEEQHREGKRIVSGKKNIVPYLYGIKRDTWTPKQMEFGMNKL